MINITAKSLRELSLKAEEVCQSGPVADLVLWGKFELSEIDSDFVKSFSHIAKKWQLTSPPSDLYFTHGQYIDMAGVSGKEFLVRELRKKPDSNRACLSLLSMKDIVQSEDKPIPSFLILQFGFSGPGFKEIQVSAYFRAIETSKFLPINIAEISEVLRFISKSFPDLLSFSLSVFAFKAYVRDGFSCLTKSPLDMASTVDVALAVESGDIREIIRLLEGKINTIDSIICVNGLETLLESIKKATHKYHGDIIINLETAVSKSKDLIQMRRSSSYSNRIHEEQELIDASIQKTIELLKTHGSGV